MTETEACIALNLVPKMGPVRLRRLVSAFGSPSAILSTSAEKLQQVEGIGPDVARSIASWEDQIDLTRELHAISEFGATVVTQSCPEYPRQLREIHDPPIVLYVWGKLQTTQRPGIGVVGTRKPTHYGADCTKKLSYQLAYSGMTVVSGLARGVDTLAHQAALAAKGHTLAVLGSGLAELYPPENLALAEKIAASGGAVLSEFPIHTQADRQTFPMRNRIISGISIGLLVIEAGQTSGALISANQATDQGRSVYAIPGQITSPASIGTNRLIQQGAKLVLSSKDILDDLGLLFAEAPELAKRPPPADLTPIEATVLTSLGDDEVHMDLIAGKSRLPIHQVSSTLLALEMRNLVKSLPGGRFVKLS